MRISYITLLGQKHPLCYSLSAYEQIGEVFGGTDAAQERIFAGDIKAICSLLRILMAAGRRYCAAVGEELPPEIKCDVADVIDVSDPESVISIFAAISAGEQREVDTVETKNATPTREET